MVDRTESDRLDLAPPPTRGLIRSFSLALLAHAFLLAAITWGVSWKRETVTLSAEAELWSAVPQPAAAQLKETVPAPVPVPVPVAPPPPPIPKLVAPPMPASPKVELQLPDPSIALAQEKRKLEKEKQQQEMQQLAQQKKALEKQRLEKERLAALKQEKLNVEKQALEKKRLQAKLEQDKREQTQREQFEKQRLQAERQATEEKKKLVQDAANRKEALQAKQEAQQQEAQRAANLKRMAGLAGATGSNGATGTALRSSGPSASYGGRIRASIRPNIVFVDDVSGNPMAEVEVRTTSDGSIASRRLIKTSGVKSWDDAVLRAIDKTEKLPPDTDGRVPTTLIISFRPKD
jgi:colicin import membrane protein